MTRQRSPVPDMQTSVFGRMHGRMISFTPSLEMYEITHQAANAAIGERSHRRNNDRRRDRRR